MDLRRERRRGNRIVGVLLVLIICAVGAIAWLWAGQSHAVAAMAFPRIEGGEERAVALPRGELKHAEKNPPDMFSYTINASPTFADAQAQATLGIKNPLTNSYWMAVEIALDETDEVVFRSGFLQPGQQLKNAALDVALQPGSYQATALICAIEPQSQDLLGVLEQSITLKIKN